MLSSSFFSWVGVNTERVTLTAVAETVSSIIIDMVEAEEGGGDDDDVDDDDDEDDDDDDDEEDVFANDNDAVREAELEL